MNKLKKLTPYNLLIYTGIGAVVWFVLAFIIIPNIEIIYSTFFRDGSFSFETVGRVLDSERAVKALRNSFILAVALPITTSIVGILQVLFIEYFDIKGSKFLTLTYMIPLVFGGLLINNGYIFVYGPNGLVTQQLLKIYPDLNPVWFTGFGAVLLVMTFGCTTNYMIFFRNQVRGLDFQTIEAAKNLGASQWTIIRKVVLPPLRPVISTIVILLFQQGLGAMAAPLIVGGRDFDTITPLILTFANRPFSRDIAAILSLILGVAQIFLLIFIQRNEKKRNYLSISKVKTTVTKQKINNPVVNAMAHIAAYAFALAHWLPFIAVIIFSFADYQSIASNTLSFDSFTLSNYIRVITDTSAYQPFVTSVIYSALSALIVGVSMTFVARLIHKWHNKFTTTLEYLLHIPWLLPNILFALGMLLAYSRPQWITFGNSLTGTWVIMLIAYTVVMLPNTLRFMKASFFGVDPTLEDAATNLGASKFYTFIRIVLPTVLPTAFALFALNFNGKLADYDLSAFLYHPLNQPVGVVIRSNADPSAALDAVSINLVYSVLLIIISSFVVWAVYFDGISTISRGFKRIFKKRPRKGTELVQETVSS